MNWKILSFVIALVVVYIAAFNVPNSADRFDLSREKLSEWWRFLTYQFVHLNLTHLIENIFGVLVAAFIAIELKTIFTDFSSAYLSSGIFAILPIWLVMQFTALGASAAIYGVYGLLSVEAKKYLNPAYIILLFVAIILLQAVVPALIDKGGIAVEQAFAHFSGFVFGILFFIMIGGLRKVHDKNKFTILRRVAG